MYRIPRATLRSSLPEIGSPVVSSLSERGGGEKPEEEEDEGLEEEEVTKPLLLQSCATSEGSSIASLPLPETKVIPGGGSEASGLPLRKERRPASGDEEEEEEDDEDEEEEKVEKGATVTTTSPLFSPRLVLECGQTRGAGGLQFGVVALDVKTDAERIVNGQRSAPRSAIARRGKSDLHYFIFLFG